MSAEPYIDPKAEQALWDAAKQAAKALNALEQEVSHNGITLMHIDHIGRCRNPQCNWDICAILWNAKAALKTLKEVGVEP